MENTIMIASIIGPIMLLLGVGLLINTKFYDGILDAFSKERALLLVSGIGGAVAGIFMVTNHNIWSDTSTIVVSILSWIVFIKSALILAFPGFFMNMVQFIKYPSWGFKLAGIIYIFLGAYLTNLAYWM